MKVILSDSIHPYSEMIPGTQTNPHEEWSNQRGN